MERAALKQILLLILFVLAFMFVMGVVMVTNAQAQTNWLSFSPDWDDWDWDEEDAGDRTSYDVRYNRVEGLYTGIQLRKEYWRMRYPSRPFLYGFYGFSFGAKTSEFQIGLEKGFFDEYRMAFGGEFHDRIDTPDRWIMPDNENSLAAFFLKEDFHDFYKREGGSGYIIQNLSHDVTLKAAYHFDSYDDIKRNVSWALFGGKKKFRDNPLMTIGELRSMMGTLVVDTRNSKSHTTRGWYIQAEGEHAGRDLGGDFDFDRILLDIRRYQSLGFSEGFDIRLRAGTCHGIVPWQKSFHLGGLGTLRGFRYKAFPNGPMNPGGNRMLLAQFEYRMGRQDLPDEIDLGILEHFNLILFTDVGWVGAVDPEEGLFNGFDLDWSDVKNDVGIGLANRSGNVRVEVARRTDTSEKPFSFYFRISRPF